LTEVINIDKWQLVAILIFVVALIILVLYVRTEFIGQGSFDYSNRKIFRNKSDNTNKKPKIQKD